MKSVVKPALAQSPPGGKGRGQILRDKMNELLAMGPTAASRYTGDGGMKKKEPTQKPSFSTKEEMAEKKWLEEQKNKVVKNSTMSIGENMLAIDSHIDQ